MGRKALPANVHLLRGNPSKLSAAQLIDETLRPEVVVPKRPRHISGKAATEWRRLGPHLEKLGLISEIDHIAFEIVCKLYARWVYVEEKIDELQAAHDDDRGLVHVKPSGMHTLSVWLKESILLTDRLRVMLAEFGMSPAARSRVTRSDPQLGLPGVDDKPDEGGWASYK